MLKLKLQYFCHLMRRADSFEKTLMLWKIEGGRRRRWFLKVPWTARKSNQSILEEISPEYSLEGLMLKLKLQYFCQLMRRADSFERTLMLEKIEGGRRRGWQRMRWSDGITNSMDMSLSKLWEMWRTGKPGVLQSTGSQSVSYWKTTTNKKFSPDPNSVRASPHLENLKHKSQKASGQNLD